MQPLPGKFLKNSQFFPIFFFKINLILVKFFVLILLKQFVIKSKHIAQSYGKLLFFLIGRSCKFVTGTLQTKGTCQKITTALRYVLGFNHEWLYLNSNKNLNKNSLFKTYFYYHNLQGISNKTGVKFQVFAKITRITC